MDELVERAARRLALGSRSFAAAARLLPADKRASVVLLYSWCRHCDDVIDDEHLGFHLPVPAAASPASRLEGLRRDTTAACFGEAEEDEFRGLERVVSAHKLPARYPLELLDGMEMDVNCTRYLSLEDTLRYCYHVAGVVGVMTAIVLGVRDRPTLERASDLGIAFQLTNIARDVVQDAGRSRIYIPQSWLDEVGLDAENICNPKRRQDLFRVVSRLLDISDAYYQSSTAGIAALPLRSAWGIATARRVYRGIGERVRLMGPGSWDERIVTTRRKKISAGILAAIDACVQTTLPSPRARSRDGLWTPDALTV